jgi:lipopolysaccharide cholinephosphotransferase
MEKLSLQENQKIAVGILDAVSKVCDEQGYRYYLVFGTLIGAVRHKGFIPWDDDLDIMMPRPDHDRFVEYFVNHREEFPNLKIFTPDLNKEYPYMITRVSDDRYRIVMENEKPYGMGAFIDIYPYDGMGDTWEEAVKFERRGDYLSSLCFQAARVHLEKGITKSKIRKIIKPAVFLLSKAIGKDFFIAQLKKQARKKPYDTSKYVGNAVWGNGGDVCIYERTLFDKYVLVDFEGKKYRAPQGYDQFLRHIYGDYMKFPKEQDRKPHHGYYTIKNPEVVDEHNM